MYECVFKFRDINNFVFLLQLGQLQDQRYILEIWLGRRQMLTLKKYSHALGVSRKYGWQEIHLDLHLFILYIQKTP